MSAALVAGHDQPARGVEVTLRVIRPVPRGATLLVSPGQDVRPETVVGILELDTLAMRKVQYARVLGYPPRKAARCLSRVDGAAAMTLCRANLTELATVVALVGVTTAGKGVVRWVPVGVASDALPPGEVDSGQMVHLPLAAGSRVEVRLEPSPGLDLGAGNPVTVGVGGSKVGLIIDLRVREDSRSLGIARP